MKTNGLDELKQNKREEAIGKAMVMPIENPEIFVEKFVNLFMIVLLRMCG